ncbi:hypothetical protein [Streptomyces sp. NPDC059802]|uniref:hypothetical protein n=1 Tax=Streptomyces sp. NPDC059802 TaxID=3346952 RepID=UPI003658F719
MINPKIIPRVSQRDSAEEGPGGGAVVRVVLPGGNEATGRFRACRQLPGGTAIGIPPQQETGL